MASERLEVAVRAWAIPDYMRHARGGSSGGDDLGPSGWELVFDTETTTDVIQRLRLGTWQLRRRGKLRQQGVFYDPDVLTSIEVAVLKRWAENRGAVAMTAAEWIEEVFLPTAWDRRGLIVGHNLPFDIARIAIGQRPAQSRDRSMRGAFSFQFSPDENASHIQVKRANAGAAFIRLTIPGGVSPEKRNRDSGGDSPDHHGYFVDTATLANALLGSRMTLKQLAKTLGTPTQKADERHGQKLTPKYLDYALDDVQVTHECLAKLLERYRRYELPKEPWQIYSEASIGKTHLEKMELTPPEREQFPHWLTAATMETYYGGRAECAIRRVFTPGVYVDFASQYPTVFVLQGLWRFITAERIAWAEEDPATVQALLDGVDVDRVLTREFWSELPVLVLVAPDGDQLPTRARYARNPETLDNRKKRTHALNVGVSLRSGGPPQWWTLADCAASKLSTGKAPHALRAIRFRPKGVQPELVPIDIAGDRAYRIDPSRDDFIKRLVELRANVRQQQKEAERRGDHELAAALDAAQLAMKVTANGTCYGSPIEMNVIEHRKRVSVTVHRPDGSQYKTRVARTEKPGTWFNPLIATLVAAGGRLLLAAAMRLVADAGGQYVFCDTDSLFIAATKGGGVLPCPGGPTRADEGRDAVRLLSHADVDEIVSRFEPLNPYDRAAVPGSVLEIERENFDTSTGDQLEIAAFAIAAKRYALLTRGTDGRPILLGRAGKLRRSEHGLGHLQPPREKAPDAKDPGWQDEWWQHLLSTELGFDDPPPAWFTDMAAGRLTVTSPRDLATFKTYNNGRAYTEQVKPWNFLAMAHPTERERGRQDGPRSLVAAFERDPERRRHARWFDRSNPDLPARPVRTTGHEHARDASYAVLTYGDYFNSYRDHPERKMLDPDGTPCHRWTRGLLRRRHVEPAALHRVGKESNRLADDPLPADDETEAPIEYPEPRHCAGCGEPVGGRRKWCTEACRKRWHRQRER